MGNFVLTECLEVAFCERSDLNRSVSIPAPTPESIPEKSRLDVIECELNAPRSELQALRNELEEFKKLF